jgi:lysozyme
MTVTRDEAMRMLADDLPAYERDVEKALGTVAGPVFDGAVSFHFNTGAIERASWVKVFRSGDLSAAEASLKSWTKAGGKVLKGLVRRRAEEADLIFRERYPDTSERAGQASSPTLDREQVEKALSDLGYAGADPAMTDEALAEAIRRFQKDRRLVVDGIAGPATWATLQRALAEKAAARVIVGAGGAGAAAGGIGAAGESGVPTFGGGVAVGAAGCAVAAMIAAALAFLIWRHRGAIALFLKLKLGRNKP